MTKSDADVLLSQAEMHLFNGLSQYAIAEKEYTSYVLTAVFMLTKHSCRFAFALKRRMSLIRDSTRYLKSQYDGVAAHLREATASLRGITDCYRATEVRWNTV